MTETNVYRIEDFVELLPPAVGHNLRHWRVEGEHTTGHGCHCQPEEIPHAVDELPVRFEEADSIVVLLRCDEDGCDAALLGEYGSKIEHGPGPMHTLIPALSGAESSTIATPSPADVDYQVLWQNAMDRAADERQRREKAEAIVARIEALADGWISREGWFDASMDTPAHQIADKAYVIAGKRIHAALAPSFEEILADPDYQTPAPPELLDACIAVTTPDGITARVHGHGEWTDRDKEALGEVIRAAKRKFDREHPETDGAPE